MLWALFQAGASSIVAAAWHADLRSASDLLSRFYAHLASDRCVPLALREAALATREAGENWRHPYHYAAFNAFGYWN
jgi:CHAT domain-containing protein